MSRAVASPVRDSFRPTAAVSLAAHPYFPALLPCPAAAAVSVARPSSAVLAFVRPAFSADPISIVGFVAVAAVVDPVAIATGFVAVASTVRKVSSTFRR